MRPPELPPMNPTRLALLAALFALLVPLTAEAAPPPAARSFCGRIPDSASRSRFRRIS